jgi:hypothetical protein
MSEHTDAEQGDAGRAGEHVDADHANAQHVNAEHGSTPRTDPQGPSAGDRRLEGWGGRDAPPLSPEQASRLQERDEPVAAGNFGGPLSGDLGNAEVADEASDAPETVQPDTSLGHEGGRRYRDFSREGGSQA